MIPPSHPLAWALMASDEEITSNDGSDLVEGYEYHCGCTYRRGHPTCHEHGDSINGSYPPPTKE